MVRMLNEIGSDRWSGVAALEATSILGLPISADTVQHLHEIKKK